RLRSAARRARVDGSKHRKLGPGAPRRAARRQVALHEHRAARVARVRPLGARRALLQPPDSSSRPSHGVALAAWAGLRCHGPPLDAGGRAAPLTACDAGSGGLCRRTWRQSRTEECCFAAGRRVFRLAIPAGTWKMAARRGRALLREEAPNVSTTERSTIDWRCAR